MDTLHLAVNVVGLCAASLGLARVKLSASAVLIHHFGSHHQGLDNPVANDIAAEIVGITSFSSSAKAYADAHSQHHRFDTFATLADPDAQLMWSLGLRPGRAYGRLKRLFWWALVSPRLHGPMSWARLKHTFGPDQPRWRRITAFTLWGGLGLAAWAGGWLSGLLGGLVLPLLVFGNVSSFVELASEHKFLLRQPLGGKLA